MGKPSMTPAKRSLLLALRDSPTGLLRLESPGRWADDRSEVTWTTATVKALVGDDLMVHRRWKSAGLTETGRKAADEMAPMCIKVSDDLWCALKPGAKLTSSSDPRPDRTACVRSVMTRLGSRQREPTCLDCRRALGFPVARLAAEEKRP